MVVTMPSEHHAYRMHFMTKNLLRFYWVKREKPAMRYCHYTCTILFVKSNVNFQFIRCQKIAKHITAKSLSNSMLTDYLNC